MLGPYLAVDFPVSRVSLVGSSAFTVPSSGLVVSNLVPSSILISYS